MIILCAALIIGGCAPGADPSPTGVPDDSQRAAPATSAPAPITSRVAVPTPTSAPTAPPSDMTAPSSTPAPTFAPSPTPAPPAPLAWSYPIGWPGQPPGDGFFIRHGYAVENTWYNPGYWHTGEDWYALNNGETAGALVYAIADGTVVYRGSNYPGRVVILRHADGLYSMYGHLAFEPAVQPGQRVTRGTTLGSVLKRSDDVPSHLHFEVRTFLTTSAVNGAQPRYGFRCGINCPPGPGYWPISAPDLPSDLGWRNPLHVINQRAFSFDSATQPYQVVVASAPVSSSVALWSEPPNGAAQVIGELALEPGAPFALLGARPGPEDQRVVSAAGYLLWYRVRAPNGREGWVQAAVPSTFETGGDGRPSSVSFNFLPAVR